MSGADTRVLVVDDEEIVRESLGAWLAKDGYPVASAPDGPSAVERLRAEPWNVILVDLKMPGMDGLQVLEQARRLQPDAAVIMMTAYATVDTAVRAMKLGATDYLVKPFDPEELTLLMQDVAAQQRLARDNAALRSELERQHRFRDLVSKSPAMERVFDLARLAAPSASTILILGESGTGKEVMARAIHAESGRSSGPFVAVSCAALTETLLESELFGHEKGAFTGAVARRKGQFEAADGGTLFLDEVGDVTPKLQLDLLRVLEDRRFHRVGGSEAIEVDARVIAATNRDLRAAVAQGAFRQDLFYRLDVIEMTLPPLRQRKEDIPLRVAHFLDLLGEQQKRRLEVSPEAMVALLAHDWPGNVRELRNALERGAVVAQGGLLRPADLGLAGAPRAAPAGPSTLEEIERRHVGSVLAHCAGNVSQAARLLGIDRVTLYNKMKKYGLNRRGGDAGPPGA